MPSAVKAVEDSLGKQGRILVRPSGTEPVIRVMAEAQEQTICQQCVERIVQAILAQGHGAE